MEKEVPETQEPSKQIPNNSKAEPPTYASLLRNGVDHTLVFLSHASNETLGACLVGLGAATYIVLGRIGLVLIGAVGGIILHASWEAQNSEDEDDTSGAAERSRRKATGLDIMRRVLDWREKTVTSELIEDDSLHIESADYSVFKPETANALSDLTDAVIRDYVKWWYSPILPDEVAFPAACRQTLSEFIFNFSTRLSRKRPADGFLDFITNSSSIFIVFLTELSIAISSSPTSSVQDAIDTHLRLKPQCNLATLMDDKIQRRKLQMVADDILERNLESNTYRCDPARIFLRKIFSNVVLEMTLQSCCRPEWINEWIIYLLEDAEPELLGTTDDGLNESDTPSSIDVLKSRSADDKNSSTARANHKRTVSRAEEAMDEAMQEAKRLTQMIIEEEARKAREQQSSSASTSDDVSENAAPGLATPTSSQSDHNGDHENTTPPRSSNETRSLASEGTIPEESNPKSATIPIEQTNLTQSVITSPSFPDNSEEFQRRNMDTFTLHKASIVVFDDANPNDKRPMKTKPNTDFMIQIEPSSSQFPGWMIQRVYADFETLHEVLRRISTISGAGFNTAHSNLPLWKGATKSHLRDELERYLNDAIVLEPLAESEGMKRFLDRDRGLARSNSTKGNFTAFENVGKGVLEVLSKAPKGVAGGGKAVIGGVSSVFGGPSPGAKRSSAGAIETERPPRFSTSNAPGDLTVRTNVTRARMSEDISNKAFSRSENEYKTSIGSRHTSSTSLNGQADYRPAFASSKSSIELPQVSETTNSPIVLTRNESNTYLNLSLPPRPSDIPDDYKVSGEPLVPKKPLPEMITHMSSDGTAIFDFPSPSPARSPSKSPARDGLTPQPKNVPRISKPMSEQEAQVTVELLFAVINELYTLSSAWQIRKTLLAAAKNFLLRPKNPQLESIRVLVQETIIEANTSDSGIATHIKKIRENCLPTEDELKKWPQPRTDAEKEALRIKARKLLVDRGMPQALTSVMGQAAGGEALGKVFDSLQVVEVARGLMFGLLLQGARTLME